MKNKNKWMFLLEQGKMKKNKKTFMNTHLDVISSPFIMQCWKLREMTTISRGIISINLKKKVVTVPCELYWGDENLFFN